MDKQASTLMHEAVIAGFTVSSRGEASKLIKRSTGGIAGDLAAAMTN